ncbi:MAG TPA: transcription termination/antitermination NusG family protein [Devosia sp.]|nr:transcription termination/antitermination NusG family protein [Devosia sp.]
MTSIRHQDRVARLRAGAFTKQDREAVGLPARPVRRHSEPPAFPANPGAYVWFALTTTKQGEAKAVLELARAGFMAFNPTEVVSMRASRKARHHRQDRERAMYTGVVLAGFPGRWVHRRRGLELIEVMHADVPWLTVLGQQHVVAFVGMGDGPVPVSLGNLMAIRARHRSRASTRNWSPGVGDRVEVSYGAFTGKEGQIVELVNGEAKVRLFGGTGLLEKLTEPLSVPEAWVKEAIA